LNLLPEFGADQRFVAARVLDATEADYALVVGVLEHVRHVGERKRSCRLCARRREVEALASQLGEELPLSPLSGRIGLERPSDERRSDLIGYDGACLASSVEAANVEVPDSGSSGSAAGLCLLGHPFRHLGREVATVELSHRAHDSVQEHSARCFIDVLGARDESDSNLLQGKVDLDVVHAVTRETIDLVHDHVFDRFLGDESE